MSAAEAAPEAARPVGPEAAAPAAATRARSTPTAPRGAPNATADDNKELDIREDAARNGTAPATDSELLGTADTADDDSGLPTAALVALILLALAGIGGGAYLMRDSLPPSLTSRLPGSSK